MAALDRKSIIFISRHQVGHLVDHSNYKIDSAYIIYTNVSIFLYLAMQKDI